MRALRTALAVLVVAAIAGLAVVVLQVRGERDSPTLVLDLPGNAVTPSDGTASPPTPEDERPATATGLSETRDAAGGQALLEDGPYGPIPRVAADGTTARAFYARPFDGRDDRSRIVILVTDLGLDDAKTEAAIRRLPPDVTLVFSPYADDLPLWTQRARDAGHEALLALPLDVEAFPFVDPGPRALLTSLRDGENLDRLAWNLGRFVGYVGVVNLIGDRFQSDARAMGLLVSQLDRRGLLYVDAVRGGGNLVGQQAGDATLPIAYVDLWIDESPSREAVDAALSALEATAKQRAIAVGLARPYPVTIDRLVAWLESLADKDLVLAPVSAVAGRQVRP